MAHKLWLIAVLAAMVVLGFAAQRINARQATEIALNKYHGRVIGTASLRQFKGKRDWLIVIQTGNTTQDVFVNSETGVVDGVAPVSKMPIRRTAPQRIKPFVYGRSEAEAIAAVKYQMRVVYSKFYKFATRMEWGVRLQKGAQEKDVFVNRATGKIDFVMSTKKGVPQIPPKTWGPIVK